MNYNYETMQIIMESADLLYTMLQELNDGIRSLPGCKMTANLKRLSANIGATSNGIYQTMRSISMESEFPCEQCPADMNEYNDADIPSGSDLKEFLDKIAGILVSDKSVSISADIYINEGHSENAGNDYDDDEDDE